jgi:hypothetical protein
MNNNKYTEEIFHKINRSKIKKKKKKYIYIYIYITYKAMTKTTIKNELPLRAQVERPEE